MTDAEIRHRLCGVKYDCLFDERLSRRMREFMATRKNRMLNALSRLEQTQQHEPKFFWEEPARSNLLTFIYWCRGSNDVAKMDEQNKRTLNKYPDNIAALTMRLRLIQTSGRDLGEAKVILEKLSDLDSVGKNETSEKSEYHILKCEGEIAFACHFLGPMFYGEAIDRYEQVIHRSNAGDTGDEVDQQRCSWHFHLAQTYNRMLNKGGKQILLGQTLESVYKVMCDNLIAILEQGKSTYKGRAMIELVDAFKKCKQLAAEERIQTTRNPKTTKQSSATSGSSPVVLTGDFQVDGQPGALCLRDPHKKSTEQLKAVAEVVIVGANPSGDSATNDDSRSLPVQAITGKKETYKTTTVVSNAVPVLSTHPDVNLSKTNSQPPSNNDSVCDMAKQINDLKQTINRQNAIITTVVGRLNFLLSMFNMDEVTESSQESTSAAGPDKEWPALSSQASARQTKDTDNLVAVEGDRRDVTANEDSSPIKFPYGQQVSLDEFVREALHEAPEDPYVLERCGRHYRKCAKTEKDYLEAIAILDKCPSRHIAWHQKGLSYVALWFLARNEGFQLQQSSGVRDGRGGLGTRGRGGGGGGGASGRVGSSSFDRAREYMLQAKSCYQQAIKLADNAMCCRYMVDLSKAILNLGQLDEAENCLVEAVKLTYFPDEVDESDASYLYEQWAYLKLKTASGNRQLGMEETEIANNKAIVLYRKSIGSAMVCDFGTKRLLGKLQDLLQQQITRSQGHDVVRVEHDLLRLAADYYGNSHQPLVDAVKNSADAADKVWELVNKLNDKVDMMEADRESDMVEGNDDVSTLSFYLAVLNKAGQLNSSDITKRRKGLRMALSSAMKLCKGPASYSQGTGDVGTAAVLLPMRNVYRWAIGEDSMRMKGFKAKDDSLVDDDFDVCILSATSTSHIGSDDFTHKLIGVLEGGIGLRVKAICDEGSSVGCLESDLELGNRREAEYVDRSVARSKSIIVISENNPAAEGRQSCRWPPDNLVATFDWLHDTPTAKVCVVVKVDDSRVLAAAIGEPEDRYNRWPRVNIDNDLLPQEVAFSLINAMI